MFKFSILFSVVCVLVLHVLITARAGETRRTEKCMENSNCDQIYVRQIYTDIYNIRSLHFWCNLNNDRFLYLPARQPQAQRTNEN